MIESVQRLDGRFVEVAIQPQYCQSLDGNSGERVTKPSPHESHLLIQEPVHVRLFPRLEGVRWTFKVHEQILPALRRLGVEVQWTDIVIRHTGYADRALRAKKLDRDTRILLGELGERPNDPFILFNLGMIAVERKQWQNAVTYLERSLAGSAPTDSITRKLFAPLARVQQTLGDTEAAPRTCAEVLSLEPDDAELWFRRGMAHRHRGEPGEAECGMAANSYPTQN